MAREKMKKGYKSGKMNCFIYTSITYHDSRYTSAD